MSASARCRVRNHLMTAINERPYQRVTTERSRPNKSAFLRVRQHVSVDPMAADGVTLDASAMQQAS
jgi:hypothetical protein